MTITELLQQSTHQLQHAGIPSASLDTEVLLAHVLRTERSFILAHGDTEVVADKEKLFHSLLAKRLTRVPVAHLIGHKEFFALDFIVSKDVLIPRPETETLIEHVLEYINELSEMPAIIDVGTGSGAIALALASRLPEAKITALDSSEKALAIALRNAEHLDLSTRVELLKSNLLSQLSTSHFLPPTSYIIIANLPYLSPMDYAEALVDCPEIAFEPRGALLGGDTGLEIIEALLKQIKRIFTNKSAAIFLEIGMRQGDDIRTFTQNLFPKAHTEIMQDLSGRDRFAKILHQWTPKTEKPAAQGR
ncbi:MAG: peptide chain release factor N(5)-glutamine methyltransferase [bacterium]|nr:peptide chain release factor N(5)-glutamine methyltransferase [bacterium]